MIEVEAIGHVRSSRVSAEDDFWGDVESRIELVEGYGADALLGIESFSHVEVLFYFDRVDPAKIVSGARHPRNNTAWPAVGIFAQRGKNRPNRIGSTIARVVRCEGRILVVAELDAIDATPVLDLKPVMAEFLPRDVVRQPAWSHELMERDLTYAHSNGVIDSRDDLIRKLASGEIDYRVIDATAPSVRVRGDHAIVTSPVAMQVAVDGRVHEIQSVYTAIYTWQAGRWQLLAYHSSPVAAE